MNEGKFPEPIVGALIFNQKGECFLMSSPKWQGKFVVPGGHIELGESAEQAIKREAKEETNLDIFDIQFVNLQEAIYSSEFHKEKHFILMSYSCKANNNDVILNKEGSEYLWIVPDESLKLPLATYTKNTILEYLNKNIE